MVLLVAFLHRNRIFLSPKGFSCILSGMSDSSEGSDADPAACLEPQVNGLVGQLPVSYKSADNTTVAFTASASYMQ